MTTKRATLEDIARMAGVSRATVSLVVRNSPLVAEKTRLKVEAVMAKLDYVRDIGAARLRSHASHTVGVIVPNLVNAFFTEFLGGIEKVMERHDRVVLMANSMDDVARQEEILQRFRGHGVDGVILCPAQGTKADITARMASWGIALVQALREVGAGDSDYAGADYRMAVGLAMTHLAERGHRKIAFLSVAADTSARDERLAGFVTALDHTSTTCVGIVESDVTWEGAAASAAQILALPDRPSAVLCFNDVLAAGLMAGLRRMGVTPGAEIAVIGLDNMELSGLTHPALTTVAVYPTQIGTNAAEMLQGRIAKASGPARRNIVTPHLVVRESTPFLAKQIGH